MQHNNYRLQELHVWWRLCMMSHPRLKGPWGRQHRPSGLIDCIKHNPLWLDSNLFVPCSFSTAVIHQGLYLDIVLWHCSICIRYSRDCMNQHFKIVGVSMKPDMLWHDFHVYPSHLAESNAKWNDLCWTQGPAWVEIQTLLRNRASLRCSMENRAIAFACLLTL